MKPVYLITFVLSLLLLNCTPKNTVEKKNETIMEKGTFAWDKQFLEKELEQVITLASDDSSAMVLVVPAYQGRVMTSTAKGPEGSSFGWINYDLISSGEIQPHINAFGGEDRIWLGPEGGQFSLYFKPGDEFSFENWQTPAPIDSEPWEMRSQSSNEAAFQKQFQLTNYSGTVFDIQLDRVVRLLAKEDIVRILGTSIPDGLAVVAYESENKMSNTGQNEWGREGGMPSVWILGMFTPSDQTTIAIPYKEDSTVEKIVTDDYFGKVPADRLQVKDGMAFFRGDGKSRGKIGMAYGPASGLASSYSKDKGVFTVVQYTLPDEKADYVNSLWEMQDDPFNGDVVNSYNDGPLEDGGQMGPFYELESSSPAASLPPGGSLTHTHRTFHFQGDEKALDELAKSVLGVGIEKISSAFE